jgi:two-component system OmpR family sensor kinase
LTQEVDNELLSIAGGSIPRLEVAGIESDGDGEVDGQARTMQVRPLRSIPTATSVTLIGPTGIVLGHIGGDLNSAEITNYLNAITPEETAQYGDRPFTVETPEHDFRVISRTLPSGLASVVVAQSFEDIDRILARLQGLFILIGLVMVFFIAFAARKMITVGLKPLANVEATAERIAEGDLTARLPDVKPNTEVGRLVSTLNTMLGRIEESFAVRVEGERKLRRFVADASHELRTPITAIRGFAELYRQGAVTGEEKTKELIGRIENESKRMGSLVEDLLLLARLDQAREMKSDPVNLIKIVSDAVASARAAGPRHTVNFDPQADEIYALGDNDRIHQVVANLLANARTHTPAGTVINVSVNQDTDGIRIRIEDNGPGLSKSDQERIFERFYRADASRVRTDGEGTGLGLSIVDAVMRAHAGQVSVESELGKGAAFTLFFPLSAEN